MNGVIDLMHGVEMSCQNDLDRLLTDFQNRPDSSN